MVTASKTNTKSPVKGMFLFFISFIFSMSVLIYFFAWDSANKINQNKDYQVSWLEGGSIFICPLH
ncbi:MAG: hypothetical protein CL772_03105 [Chloroflexi bacterium]|nr:hypothetical protein [Chloroflexota bacterium]